MAALPRSFSDKHIQTDQQANPQHQRDTEKQCGSSSDANRAEERSLTLIWTKRHSSYYLVTALASWMATGLRWRGNLVGVM